jgi:8-oxo-dGTP diphosphatase
MVGIIYNNRALKTTDCVGQSWPAAVIRLLGASQQVGDQYPATRDTADMRQKIYQEIKAIEPHDQQEEQSIAAVVNWINSGAQLCRICKPDVPNKHLVSYFVVADGDHILLVDHINAGMWLPTGGHVEPNEHPRQTALRECAEELNMQGEFLIDGPVMVTSTETVGKTSGHTDVSIWYAMKGNRHECLTYDEREFKGVKWFHKDDLPEKTDPHLGRFINKLYAILR